MGCRQGARKGGLADQRWRPRSLSLPGLRCGFLASPAAFLPSASSEGHRRPLRLGFLPPAPIQRCVRTLLPGLCIYSRKFYSFHVAH